jgi:hypothetical protein
MRAECPLAPLGDAPLEVVEDFATNRLSDEAEEMLAALSPELRQVAYRIRTKAADAAEAAQFAIQRALETGELLMQLQEGMGKKAGGNGSNQHRRATPPRGGVAPLFSFSDLAFELGVPRRTAERWMALAKANQLALRIEAREEVELPPSKDWREPRIVGGTLEHAEIAREWRESLIAGETPITRAQPALMGALATKKTGRAPCNHFVNIAAAIGKLKTSLPRLDDLPADQLAELELMWLEIAPAIPVRWIKQGCVR